MVKLGIFGSFLKEKVCLNDEGIGFSQLAIEKKSMFCPSDICCWTEGFPFKYWGKVSYLDGCTNAIRDHSHSVGR